LNQLVEKILEEIRIQGAVTFARFMECALYCPVYGFYEKEEDTVGRAGHFYTSVSVGSLFGELLARQFAVWLEELNSGSDMPAGKRTETSPAQSGAQSVTAPLVLVEAGAHKGQLARDILSWFRDRRPDLFRGILYWLVEPSERRQHWQKTTLAEFLDKVRWVNNLAELAKLHAPESGFSHGLLNGVVLSNELLDAMPVHRLGWDASRGSWFEWGVTFANGQFDWTRMARGTESPWDAVGQSEGDVLLPVWPVEMFRSLPDGFTIEIGQAASRWWKEAATILGKGKLLTIDYGMTDEEVIGRATADRLRPQPSPSGPGSSTLRAYYRHQVVSDLLARPGEQDITAHVNFSTICRTGEKAGLRTETLTSQEQFLMRIAALALGGASTAENWMPERIRQFKTLTHPDHLGRSFSVLVQAKEGSG
jgi:SAM-dependent MidA family methyltransferase